MSQNTALDSALAEAFSHLRDVSVRDGVQSWDANKWKLPDILSVVKEIDALAGAVNALDPDKKLPPIEAWGGGQVSQPAKFLYEDPLVNLQKIKEASPNLDLQCLYRGRQCFGFIPVSPEVQEAAINAAVDRGVKVFRIFDMMNDMENVTTGIGILKRKQEEMPEACIVIEGAISYISEPEGSKRAWTLDEYADYGVKLAKAGCNEIVIKNYAGVGDDEMVPLIQLIKKKLKAEGVDRPVNLHTHGDKTQLLCDAVNIAGADKVDVAIGELSGGPSHSNMRDVVNGLLHGKGFTQAEIDAHPIMKQLARTEEVISHIVHHKENATTQSFDDKRGPLKGLKPEEIEHYRMAGGALSDLWGRVQKEFDPNNRSWAKMGPKAKNPPKTPEEFFKRILERATGLWEKAGRFNTVTPGAKILTDQAIPLTLKEIYGEPICMNDYTGEYINIATGRFGVNQGMDKEIGNIHWRDALLIYRALNIFNQAINDREANTHQRDAIIQLLGLNANGRTAPRDRTQWLDVAKSPKPKAEANVFMSGYTFNLDHPLLEQTLIEKSRSVSEKGTITLIEQLRGAIEKMELSNQVKNAILVELAPGRSPSPTAGMEEGSRIVAGLKERDIHIDALHAAGKISSPEDMALLAMLFRDRDRSGNPDDSILKKIAAHRAGVELAAARPSQASGKARA